MDRSYSLSSAQRHNETRCGRMGTGRCEDDAASAHADTGAVLDALASARTSRMAWRAFSANSGFVSL